MTWFELLGLLGSIASIVGVVPICIACFKYIRGRHLYNKILMANPISLTNFYRKATPKKRRLYREQVKKLKEDIGQVPKDKLNLGVVYETLMNMIDNIEQLNEEDTLKN